MEILFCFSSGLLILVIGFMFFIYKILALPLVANMIYIHYGTEAVKEVVKELKAPTPIPVQTQITQLEVSEDEQPRIESKGTSE